MPLIGKVLAEAGFDFADLDLIAVAIGPGSFTGLRVGLAAARGIALAAARPCFGVSSFEASLEAERATAEAAWRRGETVLVALDSRRREVFAQAFLPPAGAPLPAVVAAPERLASLIGGRLGLVLATSTPLGAAVLAGCDADALPSFMESPPRASAVAAVATRRWQHGVRCVHGPDPLYLRAPQTGCAKTT